MSLSDQRPTTLVVILLVVSAFLGGLAVSSRHKDQDDRVLEEAKTAVDRADGEFREIRGSVPEITTTFRRTRPDATPLVFPEFKFAAPPIIYDDPKMPIRNGRESLRSQGFTEREITDMLERR